MATTREGLIARLLAEARTALDYNDLAIVEERIREIRDLAPDHPELSTLTPPEPGTLIAVSDESKQLSVVFCDQVGSTPFSERHTDEEVAWVRRMYHALFGRAIDLNGGAIQSYLGDGLVACFGHPHAHENDAARAVDAAMMMLSGLELLRASVRAELHDEFQVRIGVHTGDAIVADLGTTAAPLPNAIIGLTPHIASRLQDLAGEGEILLSKATADLLDHSYVLRDGGEKVLKGVSELTQTYVVEGKADSLKIDHPRLRLSPLIGRDREVEQLERLWKGAASGAGSSVMISGNAGLGKTRLLKSVRDFAFRERGSVIMTAGNELETSQPFRYVARALLFDLGLSPEIDQLATSVRAELIALGMSAEESAILATLFSPPGTGERPPLDPAELRQRIILGLNSWVARRGRAGPTCVLCDDLQWADASSRRWLRSLIESVPERVLVAAASRNAEHADRFEAQLLLQPLSLKESHRLVVNLIGNDAALAQTIVGHADGVPLFLEELSQSPGPSMPRSLKEVVQAQLEPEPTRRVAQLLATIGRVVPSAVLAEVGPSMGITEIEIAQHTRDLLDRGIIEYESPAAFRFRHHLVWQAAYETQSGSIRRSRHAVLANAMGGSLDPTTNPRADLAGRHFLKAELFVDCCTQLLGACAQSQAIGAHAEALEQLQIAESCIEHFDEATTPVFVAGVSMRRALSNASTAGFADAAVKKDFELATALSRQLVHVPELQQMLVPALMGMWSYYAVHGDMAQSRELVTDLLGLDLDPQSSVVASSIGGMDRLFRGDVSDADAIFEAVVDEIEDLVIPPGWPLPNDPAVGCLAIAAATARLVGDDARAENLMDRAFAASQRWSFPMGPVSIAFTHAYAALSHSLVGNHDLEAHHGGAAMAIGRHHGFVEWAVLGRIHTLIGRAMLGEQGLSVELAEAITSWRLSGAGLFVPTLLAFQAQLALREGDQVGAEAFLDEGFDLTASSGQMLAHSHLLAVSSDLASNIDRARELRDRAAEIARGQGAFGIARSFLTLEST